MKNNFLNRVDAESFRYAIQGLSSAKDSDNLNDLVDLFEQRKNLCNQIENLNRILKDLMK